MSASATQGGHNKVDSESE